jgi:hypothetical protein
MNCATKNAMRQTALLSKFEKINPTTLLASSFALDIEGAGFEQAYWNDGSGNFERMLLRLRQLDDESKKKSRDRLNHDRDILIAETAIKNQATLVSGDVNLCRVVLEFGGRAIPPVQFEIDVMASASRSEV